MNYFEPRKPYYLREYEVNNNMYKTFDISVEDTEIRIAENIVLERFDMTLKELKEFIRKYEPERLL